MFRVVPPPILFRSLSQFLEETLAFLDAFPKTKGHAVIIPKRKAA